MRPSGCAPVLVGLAGAITTLPLALVVAFGGTPETRGRILALVALVLIAGLVGGLGALIGAFAAPHVGAWCLLIAAAGATPPSLITLISAVLAWLPWDARLGYLLVALALWLPSGLMLRAAVLFRRVATSSCTP
jgi:hypothetical protein